MFTRFFFKALDDVICMPGYHFYRPSRPCQQAFTMISLFEHNLLDSRQFDADRLLLDCPASRSSTFLRCNDAPSYKCTAFRILQNTQIFTLARRTATSELLMIDAIDIWCESAASLIYVEFSAWLWFDLARHAVLRHQRQRIKCARFLFVDWHLFSGDHW